MLINCPECGKEISNKAESCPNCGFPINNNICIVNGQKCDLSFLLDDKYSFVFKVRDMVQLSHCSFGEVRPVVEKIINTKEIPPILNIEHQQVKDNVPHCPHCHSTNIKNLSMLNRGASIAMWGVFSKKINKSFECLDCKYTW